MPSRLEFLMLCALEDHDNADSAYRYAALVTGCDYPSYRAAIASLRRIGLVGNATRSEKDQRRKSYRVTEAGREVREAYAQRAMREVELFRMCSKGA